MFILSVHQLVLIEWLKKCNKCNLDLNPTTNLNCSQLTLLCQKITNNTRNHSCCKRIVKYVPIKQEGAPKSEADDFYSVVKMSMEMHNLGSFVLFLILTTTKLFAHWIETYLKKKRYVPSVSNSWLQDSFVLDSHICGLIQEYACRAVIELTLHRGVNITSYLEIPIKKNLVWM